MKPISEISPAIQGPYRDIQYEYHIKVQKLLDKHPNKILYSSDPEMIKLNIKLIKDLSNHFRDSLDIILNKLISKKSIAPQDVIYDHFYIWLTFINSFKKYLTTGDTIKLARESKGKNTNIVLAEYDTKINELNSIVQQIQSVIEIVNQSITNPLSTKRDYENLKKEFANILVSDKLKSLFRTLIEDVNKLKHLPALEAISEINSDYIRDYIQEWALNDSDNNNKLNSSENTSTDEEPNSNNDKSESDLDSLSSHLSTDSDSEPDSPRMSKNLSSNRSNTKSIIEHFDQTKYEIYKLTKEIAQRKSEGKILGIARIERTLSKLANTAELIKYREQQEQYWKTYFADKKPQATNSSRKLI